MSLLPLVPSVSLGGQSLAYAAEPLTEGDGDLCRHCGAARGRSGISCGDGADSLACALCRLVLELERPRIDDEAFLIWLPEMSQVAVNLMVRAILIRLWALGESLRVDARPSLDNAERHCLYYAQQALLARREAAAGRIGTTRPSELADALLRLSRPIYMRRARLLAGVRVLPSGQFFEGAADILPEIADSWRPAKDPPAQGAA